jgi:hypothetical protein
MHSTSLWLLCRTLRRRAFKRLHKAGRHRTKGPRFEPPSLVCLGQAPCSPAPPECRRWQATPPGLDNDRPTSTGVAGRLLANGERSRQPALVLRLERPCPPADTHGERRRASHKGRYTGMRHGNTPTLQGNGCCGREGGRVARASRAANTPSLGVHGVHPTGARRCLRVSCCQSAGHTPRPGRARRRCGRSRPPPAGRPPAWRT